MDNDNNTAAPKTTEELENELKLVRERFNVIFQNTSVSVWDYIFATRQIIQPERSRQLHGFDTVINNVPDSLIESGFVHPDSAKAFREMYDKLAAGAPHAEGIFRVQKADRSGYWYEHIHYNTLLDDGGRPYAAVGMSTDDTAQVQSRQELDNWRALLTGDIDNTGGLMEFNLSADEFVRADNVAEHKPEWNDSKFDEYIAAYTQKHVYISDINMVRQRLQRARLLTSYLDGERDFVMEYRMLSDEKLYWVRMRGKLIASGPQDDVYFYMLHTNITAQKEKELQLQHKADTDAITELLNHRAFTERAQEVFGQLSGGKHAVLLLDLDGFKWVNDNYGHGTGDRLLRHVAKCMTDIIAEMDEAAICGRAGGDEFAVLFYDSSREKIQQYAEKLREALAKPAMEGLWLTASIGVAIAPDDGESFDEISLAADRALYYVKRHGKDGCRFYDSLWHEKSGTVVRRQQFLSDTIDGGVIGAYIEPGYPFCFIDDKMLQWLGYKTEAEFIADTDGLMVNTVHPEDRKYTVRTLESQLEQSDTYELDYRIRKADGSYVWVHEAGEKQAAADGRKAIMAVCYDVTRQKETAHQTEEMMEAACAFANIWVFSYNIETGEIENCKRLQEEFGFPERMKNFPDSVLEYGLILPEYEQLYREQFALLRAGAPDITFELRTRLADGEVHWLRFKAHIIDDLSNSNKIAAVSAQIIDTEKGMQARLELERRKQRNDARNLIFFYVANITKDIVTEYKRQDATQPIPQNLPYTSYIVNDSTRMLAFPCDREEFCREHSREFLLDKYNRGEVFSDYQLYIRQPNGRIFCAHNTMRLLMDPATGDVMLYEYIYDVDSSQIIESMLKVETSYGYETIGNLYTCNDQFTYLDINPEDDAAELKNVSFADFIRQYAADNLYPDDRQQFIEHYQGLAAMAAQEGCTHAEVLYRTNSADGSIHYHKDDNYFYDKQRGIFLLTRREYTDVVRAEEAEKQRLEDALARAEEAGRAKNEFLARMSHDMRTPMNAIMGLTALTIDAAESPVEVRENMGKLRSASDYLLGLVNDILDMAKIEEHTLTLNLAPYLYSDFLANIRTTFMPQCVQKGITFVISSPQVDTAVRCDKTRLNQIFYNIISNAVKYTPPGGRVEYRVENLRRENGRISAQYIVSDTGIGMGEEFQKHMFEPFTRESTAVTAELQGSGLGLSITRQLVALMGGEIEVESARGKGTKVTISLSFECLGENSELASRADAQAGQTGDELRGKTVLLAEDHPINAEIAAKLLQKKGMRVLCAANGQAAVEMYKAAAPGSIDMVLMDIRMPVMDGLEATRQIRALPAPHAKTVPILAMSANAYAEDVQKSLAAGMNAHLSKPIKPETLYQALRHWLSQPGQPPETLA